MNSFSQQQAQALRGDETSPQSAAPQPGFDWPQMPDLSKPRAPRHEPAPLAQAPVQAPVAQQQPQPSPQPIPAAPAGYGLPPGQQPVSFPAHQQMVPQRQQQQAAPTGHGFGMPIATTAQHPLHTAAPIQMAHGMSPNTLSPAAGQMGMPPAAAHQMHASARIATAAVAPGVVGYKRRLRWENIFPALTLIALVTAIVLFASNWRAILGREAVSQVGVRTSGSATTAGSATDLAVTQPAMGSEPTSSSKLTAAQVAAKLVEVKGLMAAGKYDEADLIMNPMLSQKAQIDQVKALRLRLVQLEKRNSHLLNLLGRQLARNEWAAMLTTINAIGKMHPLLATQIKLRAFATGKLAAAKKADPHSTAGHGTGATSPGANHTARPPATQNTSPSAAPPNSSNGPTTGPPPVPSVPNPGALDGGNVMGNMPNM